MYEDVNYDPYHDDPNYPHEPEVHEIYCECEECLETEKGIENE